MTHTSACAVHNMPAGPCDCGAWARMMAASVFFACGFDADDEDVTELAGELIAARSEGEAIGERRGRINSMREAEIIAAMHDKPLSFIRARATAIEAGE